MDDDKLYSVWEFCKDSIDLIEQWHYKTVSKYLVQKWEKEMVSRGLIEKIDYEGSPTHIVVHFPWEGHKHISIWIDSKKEKLAQLKEKLAKYEKIALEKIRNE